MKSTHAAATSARISKALSCCCRAIDRNTLTFNTASVNVDPGTFTGQYVVSRITPAFVTGPQSVVVVRGIDGYQVKFSETTGGFLFDVDANGDVTSQNAVAAQALGNTLTLNTASINVDPGTFAGQYVVSRITPTFVTRACCRPTRSG